MHLSDSKMDTKLLKADHITLGKIRQQLYQNSFED